MGGRSARGRRRVGSGEVSEMKIEATVTEASDAGDTLRVVLQGQPIAAAEWQQYGFHYRFDVPCNTKTKRAFHVGRKVKITIKPK